MKRYGLISLALASALLVGCVTPQKALKGNFKPNIYIVRPGDSVYSIAYRYSLHWEDVAAWNKLLHPYKIKPGQRLVLKKRNKAPSNKLAKYGLGRTKPRMPETKPSAPAPEPKKAAPKVIASPYYVKPTPVPTPILSNVAWRWPSTGGLSRRFDASDPRRHGIDLSGQQGDIVRAAANGEVVYSGNDMLHWGPLVIIKHNDEYVSAYAHNSQLQVREGDTVKAGDVIARMGVDNDRKSRLHFQIRRNGKPVDPLKYLPSRR